MTKEQLSPARLLHNRVLLDARALDDLQQALRYFVEADTLWELLGDRPARHAIYKAGVVTYSRPFIPARSPGGKRNQAYPVREIQTAEGYDRGIHSHLLDLRNLFLAHTDPHAYPSRVARATFQFKFDTGETSKSEVALFTCVYSWDGAEDRDYLSAMRRHVDAACRSIGASLEVRLAELQEMFVQDPLCLGEPVEGMNSGEQRIESGQMARYSAKDLTGMTWKKPDANIGGPEYRYRVATVARAGADLHPATDGLAAVKGGPAVIDFG